MKLSLRTKGIIALMAMIAYLVFISFFVAHERNNLVDIVREMQDGNEKQAFLATLVNGLGHSLVETQAVLSESDSAGKKFTADDQIVRNLTRLRADLKQVQPYFPNISGEIDGFGEALDQLLSGNYSRPLTHIRDHEQELIVKLNDILAAMQRNSSDEVQAYHDTQQFINIVAVVGNVLAVLASVAFILIFFTRLAKDIKVLQDRAVAVVGGYDGEPLPRTRHDEIGALAQAVNQMQFDLRRWEQRQEISRQQRFHHEKMAAVGSMAAAIGHEVNNPIAAISGVAQFIMAETREAADSSRKAIHGFSDQILKHSERVATIMRRLATLTAPRSPEPDLVDLNELVESTCGFIVFDQRFSGIRLEVKLDRTIPAVTAVADHVTQILMNLLINAADAVDRSGEPGMAMIAVSTHAADRDDVCITVTDNGCGMTDEVRARAFDDSFTTKPPGKGRGIGLYLCKTLAQDGGGRIELQSTHGVGTSVDLYLPLELPARPAPEGAGA